MKYLNRQESSTYNILQSTLEPAGFRVECEVPVHRTISLPDMSSEERRFAARSRFDFVVFDQGPPKDPVFVVEYDGPFHQMPKQQVRDAKKNSFCKRAGLPVLRLSAPDIEKHEDCTVLQHVLERYISWPREGLALQKDLTLYLEACSDCERERLLTNPDSCLYDVDGILDRRHRYPPLSVIRDRLFQEWKLATDLTPSSEDESAYCKYTCAIELQKLGCLYRGGNWGCKILAYVWRKADGQIVYSASSSATFKTRMETCPAYSMEPIGIYDDAEEMMNRYWTRHFESIWTPSLPGLNFDSLVWDLAEYKAYRRIEEWAKKHLA